MKEKRPLTDTIIYLICLLIFLIPSLLFFPIAFGSLFARSFWTIVFVGIEVFLIFMTCMAFGQLLHGGPIPPPTAKTPSNAKTPPAHESTPGTAPYRRRKSGPTVSEYAPTLTRKFVLACKQEYVAFDTETTGLSPTKDRIVEISAVRFRNFEPVESWSTLIHATVPIEAKAAAVNHITPADLETAPKEYAAMHQFANFVGADVLEGKVPLVAHNVNFDKSFLSRALSRNRLQATPQYVDALALTRRDAPDLGIYKLESVAQHYGIQQSCAHRAEDDALVCGKVFSVILQGRGDNGKSAMFGSGAPRVSTVIAEPGKENPNSPLYRKRCVFTGELHNISRRDAAQAVVDIGGFYSVSVTKTTDYLILGDTSSYPIENRKTSNETDAERLIAEGENIQILNEAQFLEMIST